jgi:hypothetical protein
LTARRFLLTIIHREWVEARTRLERKELTRLGSLLHRWFLNAQRLFHMFVGLAFMGLALAAASQTFLAWEDYQETPASGLLYFKLYGGLTVLLAILCLYSFVKARNVR